MNSKYILSDADGTLVDTVALIRHGQFEAAKMYLEKHGIQPEHIPSYDRYEAALNGTVGGSARETLERTVRVLYQGAPEHLEGIDYDILHELLNPVQDRLAPSYIKAFPGLAEFLAWIGESERSLAIFTSGTPHHVVRNFGVAIPELGLAELYQQSGESDKEKLAVFIEAMKARFKIGTLTVVTCDDVSSTKPDPEGLELALTRLGGTAIEAMVLGDHSVDMITGERAGVPTRLGITHGFDDRATLESSGATAVVDNLAEVVSRVDVRELRVRG